MVGFAMALPGYREGRPYLHSHMLARVACLPQRRGLAVGLKLAQREDALELADIELMEWTFDPLEIKNAHLNIARLGAISRRYHADFYGPSSSPLQGGLPTDRLYAEWWLRSPRVLAHLRGEESSEAVIRRVEVPAAISAWKQDDVGRTRAQALQSSNRVALQAGFSEGLAVVGYERDEQGNGAYVLGPWPRESGRLDRESSPNDNASIGQLSRVSARTERQDAAHDQD